MSKAKEKYYEVLEFRKQFLDDWTPTPSDDYIEELQEQNEQMLHRIIQLAYYGPHDMKQVKKEIEGWTGKSIGEVLKDE